MSGKLPNRFPSYVVQDISSKLESFAKYIPAEFARKPRSIHDVARWKATEFRQFLLYTGPVALSSRNISDDILNNFMSLHVAISILLQKSSDNLVKYAQSLLEHFVATFGASYGDDQISHNVHNVLHIADDYSRYGPLDNCSAFSFESFMQKVLRMVRSPWRPLEQIARRYIEMIDHGKNISVTAGASDTPVYKKQHVNGPLLDGLCCTIQYEQVIIRDMVLKITEPNDACGSKNGSIIKIDNVVLDQNAQCYIVGREYEHMDDFYAVPCKSSVLGIYSVGKLSKAKSWPLDAIIIKYVSLRNGSQVTVFPLLHTVS
jgi:hypothetical protein